MELDNCRKQQTPGFVQLGVVESELCRGQTKPCPVGKCTCEDGVGGLNCDRCLPKFWAFTSFGCRGNQLLVLLVVVKVFSVPRVSDPRSRPQFRPVVFNIFIQIVRLYVSLHVPTFQNKASITTRDCGPGRGDHWWLLSFKPLSLLECGCNALGSESLSCDPQTGACRCKSGFVGDKCNICPDGTLANVTNCLRGNKEW